MNVFIVFEITECFEDPVVESVWDNEEDALNHTEILDKKEGRIVYYEVYPISKSV